MRWLIQVCLCVSCCIAEVLLLDFLITLSFNSRLRFLLMRSWFSSPSLWEDLHLLIAIALVPRIGFNLNGLRYTCFQQHVLQTDSNFLPVMSEIVVLRFPLCYRMIFWNGHHGWTVPACEHIDWALEPRAWRDPELLRKTRSLLKQTSLKFWGCFT